MRITLFSDLGSLSLTDLVFEVVVAFDWDFAFVVVVVVSCPLRPPKKKSLTASLLKVESCFPTLNFHIKSSYMETIECFKNTFLLTYGQIFHLLTFAPTILTRCVKVTNLVDLCLQNFQQLKPKPLYLFLVLISLSIEKNC
jgi:hypothetical protein